MKIPDRLPPWAYLVAFAVAYVAVRLAARQGEPATASVASTAQQDATADAGDASLWDYYGQPIDGGYQLPPGGGVLPIVPPSADPPSQPIIPPVVTPRPPVALPVPPVLPAPPTSTAGHRTYTVRAGDTLSGVAARYGTTWRRLYYGRAGATAPVAGDAISAHNRSVIGANYNLIKPGQVLWLPA